MSYYQRVESRLAATVLLNLSCVCKHLGREAAIQLASLKSPESNCLHLNQWLIQWSLLLCSHGSGTGSKIMTDSDLDHLWQLQ